MAQNGSSNGQAATPLGFAPRGFCGQIQAISVGAGDSSLPEGELERRLIELGFIEGARVEILHEGAIGRDPIAVRVNHATVALRRREAMSILVKPVLVKPNLVKPNLANGDAAELNG